MKPRWTLDLEDFRKNSGLWTVYDNYQSGYVLVQFYRPCLNSFPFWNSLSYITILKNKEKQNLNLKWNWTTAVLPLFLEQIFLESFYDAKIMKEIAYQGTLLAFSRHWSSRMHSSMTKWIFRAPWKANQWSVKPTKKYVNVIGAYTIRTARFVFTKATSGYFFLLSHFKTMNQVSCLSSFIQTVSRFWLA